MSTNGYSQEQSQESEGSSLAIKRISLPSLEENNLFLKNAGLHPLPGSLLRSKASASFRISHILLR